jgi:PKD repeat protein
MPIALLPGGKIASAGTMAGMVVGDHDTITSYAGEGQNSFFTILDTAGYVTHLEQIHGNAFYDYAISIASDRVGNLLIGGAVGDTTWAGGVGYRSHGGNTDFFVMKYGVQCGCTSMPVANFTVATSGVGGSTATFTYTGTTAGIDSMRWYFGDGTTSTTTSPSHTYSARGVFHAKVIVYTSCGNDIRATHITVPCVAAPTTAYSFSGTTATRSFTFTGTTIAVDSIVWNFGDGGRTTGSTASHSYTAIGSYTACVTVYTPCGSNSACHTVSVPCLGLPTPSFTSTGITATRNFTYTGSTTALDSVVWHYGDGGRSTGSTGAHTYASVGTYTVCVLAYTPCGVDSSCNTVTITCTTRPTAAFTNTGVTAVNFNYTGTTTGLDSVVWHYGDGGSGTGTTSSHTYATIGTFTACVLAYNHCGLDSTCHTVTVPCIAPLTASFTNTTPILGSYTDTFTYTGTTTALDSVAWYFGDGGHGTGATAAHTYAVPDTYTVCVYAYNPCGWDSACYTVIIPCDTPNAAFTYTHTNPVNFIYTGTTAHIDSVVWHFGDFTNGTGMTPTHGYPSTGTYLVCVYAYGVCAVDSFCDTVTVTGTGLAKPNLPAIRVYPNPVKNELVISDVFEPMDYRLMNIAGLTLVSGKLEPGNNNLPVKEYAPGIYLLEVTAGDGQRSRVKVVKD